MKSKKIKKILGASNAVTIKGNSQPPLGSFALYEDVKMKKEFKPTKFREAIRDCFGDFVLLQRISSAHFKFVNDLKSLGLPGVDYQSSNEIMRDIYAIKDTLIKLHRQNKRSKSPFYYTARGRLEAYALKYDDEGWVVHLCFDPR